MSWHAVGVFMIVSTWSTLLLCTVISMFKKDTTTQIVDLRGNDD